VATGWGVVDVTSARGQSRHSRVASGVIRCRGELPDRLATVFAAVCEILEQHRPEALSIEKTFVSQNVQSAFRLGEARGTVLVAAARAGVKIYEYSPAEIKMAVVGYGRALKEQVQVMVGRLLELSDGLASDEADALAAALCHLQAHRLRAMAGDGIDLRRGRAKRPSAAPTTRLVRRRWPR
jgi:crossover junction endodeoxyribonuclease RuvC